MNLLQTIEPLVPGDGAKQERRKALLREILECFEQGREDGVQKLLKNNMETLQNSFRDVLAQLEAKL